MRKFEIARKHRSFLKFFFSFFRSPAKITVPSSCENLSLGS